MANLFTMITTRGDGIALHAADWNGCGGPVLCVHGLTANCRCWDGVAAVLAGGYRVLAPDLRGRGLSDKPDSGYSAAHHVRDLAALMDDLEIPRAVFLGHSLGAYIGLAFAARYPDRIAGLILLDGGGELSDAHWAKVDAAIKPAIARLDHAWPSAAAFLEFMKQAPFLNPWNETIETYFRHDLVDSADGIRSRIRPANIREEVANIHHGAPSAHYPGISCPVLILRATEGLLTPDDILLPRSAVNQMLAAIPDARCVDVTGTDHYSILFQPSGTRDEAIRGFLTSLEPG